MRGALDLWALPRSNPQGVMSVRTYRRKLDIKNGRVELSHGAGGRAMAQLISDLFYEAFDNEWLRRGNDQAAFDTAGGRDQGDFLAVPDHQVGLEHIHGERGP